MTFLPSVQSFGWALASRATNTARASTSFAPHARSQVEPLLGPLHDLDLRGIDWVIVGGESGPPATDRSRIG
ncbi:MAG: DUF5131 family protein [bacterium]